MNALEQFIALLNSMDLGDNKEKLISGIGTVSGMVDDLKSNLTAERDKTKPLKDKIKSFGDELGLNEGFTLDDVKTFKESMNNSKELETLKEQLTAKSEADLNELRGLLDAEKANSQNIQSQYEDLQFRINVQDKGLLKDFIGNPAVTKLLVDELKPKLVFQDGKAFVNDGNGGIQKDITTNEPLPIDSLIDGLKTHSVYKDFLASGIVGGGSDVQVNSNSQNNNNQKVDVSKYKDTSSFIGDAFKNMDNNI